MRSALVTTVGKAIRRLGTIVGRGSLANFNYDKARAIDYVFSAMNPRARSFADLGGVWNVDAAYTFYILGKYAIHAACLVDTDFSSKVLKKSRRYAHLSVLPANFGDPGVPEQIGPVDVILLFDILLHQVKPDWDEILELYAPFTRAFVIFNPQFTGSESTVRLLDLGESEYFNNIPHDKDSSLYRSLFENMYELHPQHHKLWRDIHNVWQWGITNSDLRAELTALGFSEIYHKNCGQFSSLPNFENHAFVFLKS